MGASSKVVVRLTDDQRDALVRLLRTGSHPAALRRRATILLKADADGPDGWTDEQIGEHVEVSRMTVMRVRQQFVNEGLDVTVKRGRESHPHSRTSSFGPNPRPRTYRRAACPRGRSVKSRKSWGRLYRTRPGAASAVFGTRTAPAGAARA